MAHGTEDFAFVARTRPDLVDPRGRVSPTGCGQPGRRHGDPRSDRTRGMMLQFAAVMRSLLRITILSRFTISPFSAARAAADFYSAYYAAAAEWGVITIFLTCGFLTHWLASYLLPEAMPPFKRLSSFVFRRFLWLAIPCYGGLRHRRAVDILREFRTVSAPHGGRPFLATLTQTWVYGTVGLTSIGQPLNSANMAVDRVLPLFHGVPVRHPPPAAAAPAGEGRAGRRRHIRGGPLAAASLVGAVDARDHAERCGALWDRLAASYTYGSGSRSILHTRMSSPSWRELPRAVRGSPVAGRRGVAGRDRVRRRRSRRDRPARQYENAGTDDGDDGRGLWRLRSPELRNPRPFRRIGMDRQAPPLGPAGC